VLQLSVCRYCTGDGLSKFLVTVAGFGRRSLPSLATTELSLQYTPSSAPPAPVLRSTPHKIPVIIFYSFVVSLNKMSSTSIPNGLPSLNLARSLEVPPPDFPPVPPWGFVHPAVADPVHGDKFIFSALDGTTYSFAYTSMENVEGGTVKSKKNVQQHYSILRK
jgi:hypothetical protein